MENEEIVIPKVEELMQFASLAGAEFTQLNQEQTDKIVESVFKAAYDNRISLAKMANEETGIGKWEDKVIKNVVASLLVYEDIKDLKTVGIISEDKKLGVVEIAQPMGPVLAIIPVTNPTSTTIFKILISLKSRNPVIICPSRNAIKCSSEAARICYEAALEADAPEYCIQWLDKVTRDRTHALMSHKKLALILATGGGGLVKSAYSSGTPTIGVGAGNVPVYIEKSADVPFAVEQILISKTFDNGTICSSEQAIVVEKSIEPEVEKEFKKRKAYFLNDEEIIKLSKIAIDPNSGNMNPFIVGKSPVVIAEKADFNVPPDTSVLIAKLKGVGKEHPLSSEVLAPILAFFAVDNFEEAIKQCIKLNYHGGVGHSASIYSNDDEKIKYFARNMNAGRIVVNTPSSQGAVGGIFNNISPSLTLGCGTGGKNITTDNVTARHLLNIQRITYRRTNERFFKTDAAVFYDENKTSEDILKNYNKNY
jgi:acetaldehyde dehydrogenase/alcohol dehydrogenase